MERDEVAPLAASPLRDNRMYVACQTDDDIGYVVQYVGEDNLIIGSDYGHSDPAAELEALRGLQKRADVSPALARKILEDNPRAFYGL